ncbi:MAG: hypothetical protein M3Q55_12360 [Acidobacteriota bacterium]|nr:hypothetical protein [Acidobacteriota bacterium]
MLNVRLLLVLAFAFLSAGCGLIADIFKAGMFVGIFMLVIVILIVMWIARKLRRP